MRNGTVIIHARSSATSKLSEGVTAHVHRYATSVIVNELNMDDLKSTDCNLTIQSDGPKPTISFKHIAGPKKGREFKFTPSGDDAGWDEMVKFAKAIQIIWNAGCSIS